MHNGRKSPGRDHDGDRLPYRAGLDGLRALAVAGVFLYHANVSWMPGGFLGVDLFFVLSGYLITSLLLREFSDRGMIDLLAFWGRRARRLFPAVAVVIAIALLATLTIARDDLGRTRADALSAIVYLTNWHEIIASHSYFNQFGRPSLLQHLWSLAVEEQFYLFWPLLLTFGLRRWHPRKMIALTAALAVISCGLMRLLYNPGGDPSRVYYGTDTRAFTLLIGALLAFSWPGAQKALARIKQAPFVVDAAGVAALAGVLAMFVTVQDYEPWLYRGGFLLMALLGAVLVAAVCQPGARIGELLGRQPLRWLGQRSYGIYLWHWPILQLTRPGIDVSWHGPLLVMLQAAATVGVAALSYRFVEMPVRSGSAQRRLRAFLDRHTPHQRLAWVLGSLAALLSFAGVGFGMPAPTVAAAFTSTATPAALQKLPVAGAPNTANPAPSLSTLIGSAPTLGGGSGGPNPGGPTIGGVDPDRVGQTGPPASRPGSSAAGADTTPAARHRPKHGMPSDAVLALGDSVMLGCAPNLRQLIGPGLRVDAIVGRQAEPTIDRLAQYRAAGEMPPKVIIQIGDNGPIYYADLQHLRKVLEGVPVVVLVNVRLARSWQNEVNGELSSYAKTWPQATIANWYAASSQSMLSDGVHPQIDDRDVYAHTVYDALKLAEQKAAAAPTTTTPKKT